MADHLDEEARGIDAQPAPDSHAAPAPARPSFDESALRQRAFWTVPETAFLMRVGVRTVWRLMADPKSKFPQPRRVRGRTLLARDEVLQFLQESPR